MTDPVEPTRPASPVRRVQRRTGATGSELVRAGGSADDPRPSANLPVIAATPLVEPHEPNAAAAFAAQVMGQGGHKRGLRGGDETLERARSTYLETEYSGPADRRLRRGRITRTEI